MIIQTEWNAQGAASAQDNAHENTIFPVVILGGGPIGLFAVFMCGMMRLKCCIIEALPELGGQCQALYPDKPIYDIPGMPEVSASDLVSQLIQQMAPFNPTLYCGETAQTLEQDAGGIFTIETSLGRLIRTQSIIVCCGAGALVPKRPPVEKIEHFEGSGVFYSVPSKHTWAGKDIVIAGGGDSAVDWALLLAPVARSLHMVHRRTKFSAQDHSVEKLQAEFQCGRIQLHAPYQLCGLDGDVHCLQMVHIHNAAGEKKGLAADILLPFFGMQNDLGPISQWGLSIENQRIVTNPLTGETSRPGIYAAGDIVTYPHKLKLIMTGFSEMAQIAHHLKGYLFPDQFSPFKHSTTLGDPREWV
jgi:thioredoxin reductase (NADPH)